jgi:hypothetical protein
MLGGGGVATHGDCCWMNRTIPHNLGVLRDYAKKRGGKVVVVPDGMAPATSEERKHGEKSMPTAAQQAVRAARDRKYLLRGECIHNQIPNFRVNVALNYA